MTIKSFPQQCVSHALLGAALCIGGGQALAASGTNQTSQPANASGEKPEKAKHGVVRTKVAHPQQATKPQRAIKQLKQK